MKLYDMVTKKSTLDLPRLQMKQLRDIVNRKSMLEAAKKGSLFVSRMGKENIGVQFLLLDKYDKPISKVKYEIRTNDGVVFFGKTDHAGKTEIIKGYAEADCNISYQY